MRCCRSPRSSGASWTQCSCESPHREPRHRNCWDTRFSNWLGPLLASCPSWGSTGTAEASDFSGGGQCRGQITAAQESRQLCGTCGQVREKLRYIEIQGGCEEHQGAILATSGWARSAVDRHSLALPSSRPSRQKAPRLERWLIEDSTTRVKHQNFIAGYGTSISEEHFSDKKKHFLSQS